MRYLHVYESDPHYGLVVAPEKSREDFERKQGGALTAGSLSIGARVELLRQVCNSPFAVPGERASAARSIAVLCLHSEYHYHVAHRIGSRIALSQNRSIGDSAVASDVALYSLAWDVATRIQKQLLADSFELAVSLAKDAELLGYDAHALASPPAPRPDTQRRQQALQVLGSVRIGPTFVQGFSMRGQQADATELHELGHYAKQWKSRGSPTEQRSMPKSVTMTMAPRAGPVLKRITVEHFARNPLPRRSIRKLRLPPSSDAPAMQRGVGLGMHRPHLGERPIYGLMARDVNGAVWLDQIRALAAAGPRVLEMGFAGSAESAGAVLSHDAEVPLGRSVKRRFADSFGGRLEHALIRSEGWRLTVLKPPLYCELGWIMSGREDWAAARDFMDMDGRQASLSGTRLGPIEQAIYRGSLCVLSRLATSPWPAMAAGGLPRGSKGAFTKKSDAISRDSGHTSPPRRPKMPPLRVSFASGDLGHHPVGFALQHVLAQLDRRRVHATLLSLGKEDEANDDRDNVGLEDRTDLPPKGRGGPTSIRTGGYGPPINGSDLAQDAMAFCEQTYPENKLQARPNHRSDEWQRLVRMGVFSQRQVMRLADVAVDDGRRMSQSMRLRRAVDRFVGLRSVLARFASDTTDSAFEQRRWQRDLVLACYHGNRSVDKSSGHKARGTFPGWSVIPLTLGNFPIDPSMDLHDLTQAALKMPDAEGCDPVASAVVPPATDSHTAAAYGVMQPANGRPYSNLAVELPHRFPANARSSHCENRQWVNSCQYKGSPGDLLTQAVAVCTTMDPSVFDEGLLGNMSPLAGLSDVMFPVRYQLREMGVYDDRSLRMSIVMQVAQHRQYPGGAPPQLEGSLSFFPEGLTADVLIDLTLVTMPPMMPAMAMRPCRVQAAFLGYAMTMASSSLSYDYWLADEALVPPDEMVSFSRSWRLRERLRRDPRSTLPLEPAAAGVGGYYAGGTDCLTCDVSIITSNSESASIALGRPVRGAVRRIHLPADKVSGLGIVLLPHSYHPRGAKFGLSACGLGYEKAATAASHALYCQEQALAAVVPHLRTWKNILAPPWALGQPGNSAPPTHSDFLRHPQLGQALRRLALDGGLGERRMYDIRLRESAPDPGRGLGTTTLLSPEAEAFRHRLLGGLSTPASTGAGVQGGERRRLFLMLPGETYKLIPLMYDAVCGLLRRVPRAVLVLKGPKYCESAYRMVAEAAARGISPGRLLFLDGRVPMVTYAKRLLAADVVLDTYPFGAHSLIVTPSTLGVPLVGLRGAEQVGRVGPGMVRRIDKGLRSRGKQRGVAGLLQSRSLREQGLLAERLLRMPEAGRGILRHRLAAEAIASGFLSDTTVAQSIARSAQLMWEVRAVQVGGRMLQENEDLHRSTSYGVFDGIDGAVPRPSGEDLFPGAFNRVLRLRAVDRPARGMLLGWLAMHIVVDPEASGRSGTQSSAESAKSAAIAALLGGAAWADGQAEGYRVIGQSSACTNAKVRADLMRMEARV